MGRGVGQGGGARVGGWGEGGQGVGRGGEGVGRGVWKGGRGGMINTLHIALPCSHLTSISLC